MKEILHAKRANRHLKDIAVKVTGKEPLKGQLGRKSKNMTFWLQTLNIFDGSHSDGQIDMKDVLRQLQEASSTIEQIAHQFKVGEKLILD